MKSLFSTLKIGNMELKNRIAMAPMSLGYESEDGLINEKMSDYWEERAKGGTALIIVDAVTVDRSAPYLGNTTGLFDDSQIPSFKKFTDKIHAHGARVIPQITHPGPESISAFFGVTPVAPSVYPNALGNMTRELTIDEIKSIVEKYGQAALRAKKAGCDGIELHCAHAYMLAGAFLSPLRNKRTDIYGGSLDNRARFVFEVIDSIKEKAGEDFPIILRMSGDEKIPGGNTLDDMLYLVPKFIERGISAFEVSGGTQYEKPWNIIPCHGTEEFINLKEAKKIKEISSIPVITVGKINDPNLADNMIEKGYIDGVVIGRALLADSEFANKAKTGRIEDVAPCVGCGLGCIGEQSKRKPGTCVINPALGREKELEIKSTNKFKRVLVIGGGVAGLEAARVAALRGHDVTLIEKENKLGGQINIAVMPPFKQSLSKWVIYLTKQIEKLGVKVILGSEATEEFVEQLNPYTIMIATGAEASIPPIKGVENEKVTTSHKILSGEKYIPRGNVLVIGGGMVGCETAEMLKHNARGKMNVTIVEALEDIALDDVPNNKIPMTKRLIANGANIYTETKVDSIKENSIVVERNGKKEELIGFTDIVLACGAKSVNQISETLKGSAEEIHVIGDAKDPRRALEAIREGSEIARII